MIEGLKRFFSGQKLPIQEASVPPRIVRPEIQAVLTDPTPILNNHPFHRTKEIIEDGIGALKAEKSDQSFPEVSIERKEIMTVIGFEISKETDRFALVNCLANTLGEISLSSHFRGNITLKKDAFQVSLYDGYLGNSISFTSCKDLSDQEIESILNVYKLANAGINGREKNPIQMLADLGATVYDPDQAPGWDYLAGYSAQKQQVKDTIIGSFQHPGIYEQIAKGTRKVYEQNYPKAVLFEGPPGTGKTTMARMIAGQVAAPLVYVPIESIMTKWYGESEKNLAEVFNASEKLGSSMIFLDEIDSLAMARDRNIHEATRRILSVLLRKIDGFNPSGRTILIGATNRKDDLDPALLSRFNVSINFPLPNDEERQAIFGGFAKHLDYADLILLAQKTESLSGRDIRNLCERAERSWASKLIAEEAELTLPAGQHYLAMLNFL